MITMSNSKPVIFLAASTIVRTADHLDLTVRQHCGMRHSCFVCCTCCIISVMTMVEEAQKARPLVHLFAQFSRHQKISSQQ